MNRSWALEESLTSSSGSCISVSSLIADDDLGERTVYVAEKNLKLGFMQAASLPLLKKLFVAATAIFCF